MSRTQVQFGSQGKDVEELQNLLNQKGYNLTVDGIFGNNTLSAVKDYQKKSGLSVDGIVGVNTWGSLTSAKTTPSTTPTNTNGNNNKTASSTNGFTFKEYEESDIVKQAQDALNAQMAQKPGAYQSQWQTQLDDIMNKIQNREKFSYNFNEDALYQQYKDKAIQQGKMAMGDAIGQASAMTGGYGNSYAQSVGQQMYQKELQNLNDVIPELYQMALDRDNQEKQDLYNQFAMLGDRENLDYNRYRDSVNDWQSERDYLTNQYNTERDYDYSKYVDDRNLAYTDHRNSIADAQWQKEFDEAQRQYYESLNYQKERDKVTDAQWQKQYDAQYGNNATESKKYSYSGTTPSGKNYNNGGLSDAQVKRLQAVLGVTADGYYGEKSKKAAGGLSAEQAYAKYIGTGEKDESGTSATPFNGKTYEDAVAYAKSNGVPGAEASNIMTRTEWARRKNYYQSTGQGGAEVKNYNTYQDYLNDITEYLVSKNSKNS